jgi:hypothetical protein
VNLGDIQPNVPVLVAGAFALFAWVGVIISFRRDARTRRALQRMRPDVEFATWSRTTFVAVRDREGKLFFRSLWELHDSLAIYPEMIWAEPRGAFLYHADSDDPDPYGFQQEGGDHGRPY